MTWRVLAATGHRNLAEYADKTWLAENLIKAVRWAYEETGTRVALSGLGLGFDMDFAEAALDVGMRLWVAIAFEGQASPFWSRPDRARFDRLRAAAERERVIGAIPATLTGRARSGAVNKALHDRNIATLDFSHAVLTDWEPGRFAGGTANTLREAAKRGTPGIHLDPINQRVRFHLPPLTRLEPYALVHTGCRHVTRIDTQDAITERLDQLSRFTADTWRMRPASPYEQTRDCGTCIADAAAAAAAAAGVPVPA